MKKYTFLSMALFLGISISSFAQTEEVQSQGNIKNVTTQNKPVTDSLAISKSLQIRAYKFSPISLDGPRIIVIDGKVSEQGYGDIKPNDIRSLSVVNGEKAASLYGYKNGSGVIIITTKRGANDTKVENHPPDK